MIWPCNDSGFIDGAHFDHAFIPASELFGARTTLIQHDKYRLLHSAVHVPPEENVSIIKTNRNSILISELRNIL